MRTMDLLEKTPNEERETQIQGVYLIAQLPVMSNEKPEHECVTCNLCDEYKVQLMFSCCKKLCCYKCTLTCFKKDETCPYCRQVTRFVIPVRF